MRRRDPPIRRRYAIRMAFRRGTAVSRLSSTGGVAFRVPQDAVRRRRRRVAGARRARRQPHRRGSATIRRHCRDAGRRYRRRAPRSTRPARRLLFAAGWSLLVRFQLALAGYRRWRRQCNCDLGAAKVRRRRRTPSDVARRHGGPTSGRPARRSGDEWRRRFDEFPHSRICIATLQPRNRCACPIGATRVDTRPCRIGALHRPVESSRPFGRRCQRAEIAPTSRGISRSRRHPQRGHRLRASHRGFSLAAGRRECGTHGSTTPATTSLS